MSAGSRERTYDVWSVYQAWLVRGIGLGDG